jgi:hypothetical protein
MSRLGLRATGGRRLAVAALLLLVLWLVPACDDPDPAVCVSECVEAPLGEEQCEIALSLDANCEAYVTLAEVAVGQCLEPETLKPGETLITCARPALGDSFTWTVRSETWQWGPWKDLCAQGAARMDYRLGCK